MSWILPTEKVIDGDTLRHLHSEIRTARQFWYDKSLAYLSWYTSFALALLSAFFLLLTKKDDFGSYLGLLTILPLIAAVLCHYARKSIRICYRQFLEHTTMMAKLDYILGMYQTPDPQNRSLFFEEDNFISPQRHFDYVRKFEREDQFGAAELDAPERTYHYKLRIFRMLQVLAIILAVIVARVGGARVVGVIKSFRSNDATVHTQRQNLNLTELVDKRHGGKTDSANELVLQTFDKADYL
jgi:hypothetical protein